MTRALPILLLLSACASPVTDSYSLGRGIATYDELRRQTEICAARGGTIRPTNNGGDPTQLSNYTCVIARGS
jgi:hypothetical protein